MKKVFVSFAAVLALFLMWSLWLSPTNTKSPFVSDLKTPAGERSVFVSDIFGNVYFESGGCHELGCGHRNRKLAGENVEDFSVLTRVYGKSSNRVYKGVLLGGKMPNIDYFDAATFEVIREEHPEITRDKNYVYYNTFHRIWGVEDTSTFSQVSPEVNPRKGRVINWHKDSNNVYYQGTIVRGADPGTIKLILTEDGRYTRAKDKNYVYDASKGSVKYVGACSSAEDCISDLRIR